jgi:MFS family permease
LILIQTVVRCQHLKPLASGAVPEADATPIPPQRKNLILLLACLGQFMVVLDVAVVNVALPAMRNDLHFSPTGLQWVVNAYTLTYAGFLLLGGRIADLFGRRRMFLVGLLVFTLASLVCGLAPNGWAMITARAVQGTGAAILSPVTLTLSQASPNPPATQIVRIGTDGLRPFERLP